MTVRVIALAEFLADFPIGDVKMLAEQIRTICRAVAMFLFRVLGH